jgi:hypothetical protein
LTITFSVSREDQPAEFWLDDIRFLTKESLATPLAPVESVAAVSADAPNTPGGASAAPAVESRTK